MESIRRQREAGTILTKKIKNFYYLNEKWSVSLANKIAKEITQCKIAARPYFPGKDNTELLNILNTWGKHDMDELLQSKDGLCKDAPQIDSGTPTEPSTGI